MSTTPLQAPADQLRHMLPGMPDGDPERFAASLTTPGPFTATPVCDDVPRGTLTAGTCPAGTLYPGVPHAYQLYRPAGHDAGEDTTLIVFMDGARYLGPEANAGAVLDQLIHAGELPPTVTVFVEPGAEGPGLPIYGGPGNRSAEYDAPGDAFARFLIDELLPHATQGLRISGDPARRALVGLSSGGHAALNAAWEASERPGAFGLVATHCGSFVNIRGGHELAGKIRRGPPRPLKKVFLQTGEHDLDIVFGHWPGASREMAAALAYRGIEHRLVIGQGGHSLAHGGALLPDTLRWLFQ